MVYTMTEYGMLITIFNSDLKNKKILFSIPVFLSMNQYKSIPWFVLVTVNDSNDSKLDQEHLEPMENQLVFWVIELEPWFFLLENSLHLRNFQTLFTAENFDPKVGLFSLNGPVKPDVLIYPSSFCRK